MGSAICPLSTTAAPPGDAQPTRLAAASRASVAPWMGADLRDAVAPGSPGSLPASPAGLGGSKRNYPVICCGSAVATRRGYGLAVFSQVGCGFPGMPV